MWIFYGGNLHHPLLKGFWKEHPVTVKYVEFGELWSCFYFFVHCVLAFCWGGWGAAAGWGNQLKMPWKWRFLVWVVSRKRWGSITTASAFWAQISHPTEDFTRLKFNIAPENKPSQKKSNLPTSSNHHFSRAMWNFGGVENYSFISFFAWETAVFFCVETLTWSFEA